MHVDEESPSQDGDSGLFSQCNMIRIFSFIAILAWTADGFCTGVPAKLPVQPMFSVDVDTFLGQNTRRRSGGGRVWTNLYYGGTTLKPKQEDKIHPTLYGVQLGLDVQKAHGVYSTCFFNFNQSKTRFDGNPSTIDNYLLGYGKFWYLQRCHFVFTGSIGYDQHKISNAGTYQGDGLQANLFSEYGLNIPLGRWGFKPFYALHYDFLYQGKIGSGGDVLKSEWNGHGLNQLFGLRINWQAKEKLTFQGRAVWLHEMLDHPPPFYHVRFSPTHGINTPAIMHYRGNTGRDWAWLGIGGKLEGAFNVYLFFDYDLLLNERHITHLASFGLCLGW